MLNLAFINLVTFFHLMEPISPIVYNISIQDLFLPGLILGCGVYIFMLSWRIYTTPRIAIPDLVNSRDVTPAYSLEGKEKRKRPRPRVVDLTYVMSISGNNIRYHLLIDVLDSTGSNLKALYPRPSILQTACTFNGLPWVGLKFESSAIDRPSNNSQLFKETNYTSLATQHTGCWVPRPNMTNTSTQNTTILSAASAIIHSADGRSVFAKKQ